MRVLTFLVAFLVLWSYLLVMDGLVSEALPHQAWAVTDTAEAAPEWVVTEKPAQGCQCPQDGICFCGNACRCGQDDYDAALAESIKTKRFLVVWVDCVYPSCEAKLPGCIHCHVKTFEGAVGPCVVVSKGGYWLQALQGDVDAAAIGKAMRTLQQAITAFQTFQAQPVYYGGGRSC